MAEAESTAGRGEKDLTGEHMFGIKINSKKNPVFADYLIKFWTWEESDYVKSRLAGGFSITETYVRSNLLRVKKHVIAFFGRLRLRKISTGILEDFKMALLSKKTVSTRTVHEIMQIVKKPLREAKRLNIISHNPGENVTPVAKHSQRRGILTSEEARRLFGIEWRNEKSKLANMLACCTGMRKGEIGALCIDDIKIADGIGIIEIRHSFEPKLKKMKPAKSNKDRMSCIPVTLLQKLTDLHGRNPHADKRYVFWGAESDMPVNIDIFRKDFIRALMEIGMTGDRRKERRICFHSWRHFYNSHLRGSIPDEVLRKVIGHESVSMTDNYDHATKEQMRSVYAAVNRNIVPVLGNMHE
jgi:integrase